MRCFRLDFNRQLKLEFHDSLITSDAGLPAFREFDDVLGLSQIAGNVFTDMRAGRNSRHGLVAQFRQTVFGRLAGYEDVNDADRFGCNPAMRFIVHGHAVAAQAASTSQMWRFGTEVTTQPGNLGSLVSLSGQWIKRIVERRPTTAAMLDMDSSISPTFGDQENMAYNGHFG